MITYLKTKNNTSGEFGPNFTVVPKAHKYARASGNRSSQSGQEERRKEGRRESEVRSAAAATERERELRKRKSSSGEGKTNLVQTASALRPPPGKSAS